MALRTKLDTRNTTNFKFEKVGQKLQGYYIGTFDEVINGREVKKHVFKTELGLESVLGQTHLTNLLSGIDKGIFIVATFVGTKKTKQPQPMKLFELQYDEEDTIDASAVVGAASESEESVEESDYSDASEESSEEADYLAEDSMEEEVEEEQAPPPVKRSPPKVAAKAPVSRPTGGPISDAAKARAAALMAKKAS